MSARPRDGRSVAFDARPSEEMDRQPGHGLLSIILTARRLRLGGGLIDHGDHLRDAVGGEAAAAGVLAHRSSLAALYTQYILSAVT